MHLETWMTMLTPAVEDYLKTIYKLEQQERTTTAELAKALAVAPASATNMVKRLEQLKLVNYESYKGFHLTDDGKKIALEIIRHQRLLETYLIEHLGYTWDEVHSEAEKLEHHISEEFEDRIDKLLGHPTHDPHGDPIPTREGEVPEYSVTPLAAANPGDRLLIQRVAEEDPELLRYLAENSLTPGEELLVKEIAPFNGPVTVEVKGKSIVVGREVSTHIFVDDVTPSPARDTATN